MVKIHPDLKMEGNSRSKIRFYMNLLEFMYNSLIVKSIKEESIKDEDELEIEMDKELYEAETMTDDDSETNLDIFNVHWGNFN